MKTLTAEPFVENYRIYLLCSYNIFLFQVKNAETCGAVGVVFYSDPKDFSRRLPGWAVVRGSILNPAEGDPLSPGVAAVGKMITDICKHLFFSFSIY